MPKVKPPGKPDSPFPLRRSLESRDALKSFRPSFRPQRGKSELVRELVDLRGWRESSDVIASQDLDEAAASQASQASDVFPLSQASDEPDMSSTGSESEPEPLEESAEPPPAVRRSEGRSRSGRGRRARTLRSRPRKQTVSTRRELERQLKISQPPQ